jgi:hypothetical protein
MLSFLSSINPMSMTKVLYAIIVHFVLLFSFLILFSVHFFYFSVFFGIVETKRINDKNKTKGSCQNYFECWLQRPHGPPVCAAKNSTTGPANKTQCHIKFMHSFTHNFLPISFHQMWISNRKRNPDRVLRNADQLFCTTTSICNP